MIDYSLAITPTMASAKKRQYPETPREELLKRNSFPSVNENKHIDKMIKGKKNG